MPRELGARVCGRQRTHGGAAGAAGAVLKFTGAPLCSSLTHIDTVLVYGLTQAQRMVHCLLVSSEL